ncbi:MAG: hypothetical protein NW216_03330 [Hyphomicrobium sp.]|nr:hypothetical protein [Hyphomicrobium sp.]
MNSQKSRIALPAIAVIAMAGGIQSVNAAVANAPPSVLVFNQKPAGNAISIDYANLPTNGYVVVYAGDGKGGKTGEPLGHAELKAGSHMDIKVELKSPPAAGSTLWASLYKDKDGKEGFTPGADKPVWDKVPLQNEFKVE